jgi:hypothetical protein
LAYFFSTTKDHEGKAKNILCDPCADYFPLETAKKLEGDID